jgi:hypothetical protein
MSATIWKSVLRAVPLQEVELPAGAEILCAAEQFGEACIWYRCDPLKEKEMRRIGIAGTGHVAPTAEQGRYIGTAFLSDGALVLHVFERLS